MNMDIVYKLAVPIGIFLTLCFTMYNSLSSKNRNKVDEKVKQEKFNSVAEVKLDQIEKQVNNHIPTQIKEVKTELKKDINKLETKIDNNQKEVNNKLDKVLIHYSNKK